MEILNELYKDFGRNVIIFEDEINFKKKIFIRIISKFNETINLINKNKKNLIYNDIYLYNLTLLIEIYIYSNYIKHTLNLKNEAKTKENNKINKNRDYGNKKYNDYIKSLKFLYEKDEKIEINTIHFYDDELLKKVPKILNSNKIKKLIKIKYVKEIDILYNRIHQNSFPYIEISKYIILKFNKSYINNICKIINYLYLFYKNYECLKKNNIVKIKDYNNKLKIIKENIIKDSYKDYTDILEQICGLQLDIYIKYDYSIIEKKLKKICYLYKSIVNAETNTETNTSKLEESKNDKKTDTETKTNKPDILLKFKVSSSDYHDESDTDTTIDDSDDDMEQNSSPSTSTKESNDSDKLSPDSSTPSSDDDMEQSSSSSTEDSSSSTSTEDSNSESDTTIDESDEDTDQNSSSSAEESYSSTSAEESS